MKVSTREEELARELYGHDMGQHQGEYVRWIDQIEYVKDSYRRQAMKFVNSNWFKTQIGIAHRAGATEF